MSKAFFQTEKHMKRAETTPRLNSIYSIHLGKLLEWSSLPCVTSVVALMINDVREGFRWNFSLKSRYFLQFVQTKTNCSAGLGVSITALTTSVEKPWKLHTDWWCHAYVQNHIWHLDVPQREIWKSACFLICMFTHMSIDVSLHLFPDFCYQLNISALPQPWTLHTTCLGRVTELFVSLLFSDSCCCGVLLKLPQNVDLDDWKKTLLI